jgi:hypothetical protein
MRCKRALRHCMTPPHCEGLENQLGCTYNFCRMPSTISVEKDRLLSDPFCVGQILSLYDDRPASF